MTSMAKTTVPEMQTTLKNTLRFWWRNQEDDNKFPEESADHATLRPYFVEPLRRNNRKIVTVLVSDPFVSAAVETFLKEFVDIIVGQKDVVDELGFWNE
ncbi:hypothetical protein Z043_126141 [Scleropages formosus]|uniref:Uncharacterized protein n=1 Tax=Scleropages formosus TaxID=113540 RepID=A0A0P7U992_SCLFO|nr:hypothetical protein Z043_126141 [Scleropages formosus]